MNLGIFIIGAIVTSMVVGALVLLLYGAVVDGRESIVGPGVDGPGAPADNVAQFVSVTDPTTLHAS